MTTMWPNQSPARVKTIGAAVDWRLAAGKFLGVATFLPE
jgi:hypothetical protein